MLTFTVLFMTVVTVLLAIFLLFKVSTIKITGDVIEKYGTDEILRVSGCKTGENLVFLPTGSREEALKEQLPYIGEVEFIRHFPGTLEIRVTAAKVAACVSSGGGWLYVNDSGKILENQKEPQNGILQILGLSPLDTEPGDHLRLEDSSAQDACDAILKTVAELEMTQEFTRVDISNLSDIRLLYQDRIELQLGNVLDLDYKIELGCRSLEKLEKLEEKLNYDFHDPALLEEALCHSSYANEHRGEGMPSNERLEFLGDSILGYKSHMGAGSITSNVKSDKTLVVVKAGEEAFETGLKNLAPCWEIRWRWDVIPF